MSRFKEGDQHGDLPQGKNAEIIDAPVGTTKYLGGDPLDGELVNAEGYFDNTEANVQKDGSSHRAVGGPQGDVLVSSVSQIGDSVSHITYKDGVAIDTQSYVAQKPKGLLINAVTKTVIKKVPGVVQNPRQ